MAMAVRPASRALARIFSSPQYPLSQLRSTASYGYAHGSRLLSDVAPQPTDPFSKNPAEDLVKRVFFNLMKKVKIVMDELAKVKFTVDPDDPKAVEHYSSTMRDIRKKAEIPSLVERIDSYLNVAAQKSPDVRTYLMSLSSVRKEFGIEADQEADKLMLDAVTKVEKKIGKTLTRDNAKGMALLKSEFASINSKLGIDPSHVPELETKVELDIAKLHLEEMKKGAIETMETYKRRDGLEEIQVDVKTLDHRKWL